MAMLKALPCPDFTSAALAASNVGTWERDADAGVVRCDCTMATMFGLSGTEAQAGVPLQRFSETIHPDDRFLFEGKVEEAKARGGLIVLEYRIIPHPNLVRRVLVRGRYEPVRPGQTMAAGRGIVIDITESKQDDQIDESALFVPSYPAGSPLDSAAEHALAARAAIDRHDPAGRSPLRERVDALLWDIGHSLAASLREEPAQREGTSFSVHDLTRH